MSDIEIEVAERTPEEVAEDEAAAAEAAKRQKRIETNRAIDHVAEIWVEMSGTDAFKQLAQELDRQAERYRKARYAAIMGGDPIEQREVDYERGLIEGLGRVNMVIETARKRLLKRDAEAPESDDEVEEGSNW